MSWQIYIQYDEDSLTLHSNAGLLRRAKKSLPDVKLIEKNHTELQFQVEDCKVILYPQGITTAQCNCSSIDCCKHILSSILWIQQNIEPLNVVDATNNPPETHPNHLNSHTESHLDSRIENNHEKTSTSSFAEAATSNPQIAHDDVLIRQILAFDTPSILKQAGKINTRLAFQFFQNWCQNPELCQIEIQAERISFKTELSPSKIFLYPQLGLTGMLSEIPDKQRLAGHVACIAYFFKKHTSEEWHWPENLNLSQTDTSDQLTQDDVVFIHEIQRLCLTFIQQGLSHLAKESVLALHILNMQARAQDLPRLASELRRLHGAMRQFLDQNTQIDEAQIFNQLAYLYSYLAALLQFQNQSQNQNQPSALKRLRGSIQRDYQEGQVEHLIPLGCEWWQLDSGARGLTVCFWDVQQNLLTEVTQARANYLDQTFNKQSAESSGIWGTSLDYLLKHQIQLTQAKLSSEMQLSASTDTRFLQKGLITELKPHDFNLLNIGYSDWQQFQQALKPQSSIEQSTIRYAFLRHKEINKPELNELEQCFECRVVDEHNISLKLSIPIQPEYQIRIKHLTQLIQNENIIATLVRIDSSKHEIRLIPCSIFLHKNEKLSVFSLDYHSPPRPKKSSLFELISGRIEKLLEQKKQWQSDSQQSAFDILMNQTQSFIEFYANIGRAQLDSTDQTKLFELAQQFDALGLSLLSQSLKKRPQECSLPHLLLQWRHLLLQLQRLTYKLPLEGQVMSC